MPRAFRKFLTASCTLMVVHCGDGLWAQAPARNAPAAKPWTPPRTADGVPDLQGVWSFATLTPLERPQQFAGQDTLTAADKISLERRAAESRDATPAVSDRLPVGGYNNFWNDTGKVAVTGQSSLIVDPPDGKLPPLTKEAEARTRAAAEVLARAENPESRTVFERCLLGLNAGPPMIPSGYNNNVQLIQTGRFVAIVTEMNHTARIVPLDRRPHLDRRFRLLAGDSRGRWERDTLVVETTNFTDKGTGTFTIGTWTFRPTTDENLRLVERFTRIAADTLLYEFTIDDPTVWTKPWTARIPMIRSEEPIYEYACHEGNYGLANILRGARVQEAGGGVAATPPDRR